MAGYVITWRKKDELIRQYVLGKLWQAIDRAIEAYDNESPDGSISVWESDPYIDDAQKAQITPEGILYIEVNLKDIVRREKVGEHLYT